VSTTRFAFRFSLFAFRVSRFACGGERLARRARMRTDRESSVRLASSHAPNRARFGIRVSRKNIFRRRGVALAHVRGIGKFPGRFAICEGPRANCLRRSCLPPTPGAPANSPNMLSLGTAMGAQRRFLGGDLKDARGLGADGATTRPWRRGATRAWLGRGGRRTRVRDRGRRARVRGGDVGRAASLGLTGPSAGVPMSER